MKRRKLLRLHNRERLVLVLLVALLALFGVGREVKAADPIKIGYIDTFSGIMAVTGQSGKRGTILAEAEINEKGGILGRKLEVIYADNESSAGRAATVTKRLIQRNKVCAISAGTMTSVNVAMSKVASKEKIPYIGDGAGGILTEPLNPWIFRNYWRVEDGAKAYLLAARDMGLKKVAVFYIQNTWGLDSLEYCKREAPKMGMQVVAAETCEAGASDVTVQAGKFRDAGADVIIQFQYEPQNAALYRAKGRLEYKVPTIQLTNILDAMVRLVGKEAVEGTLVVGELDLSRPEVAEVYKRGQKRFGKDVMKFDCGVALGYGNLMLFAKAIKKAGSDNPAAIRDALETFTGESSFMGNKNARIRWSSTCHDGMVAEDFARYWYRNGEYIPISE